MSSPWGKGGSVSQGRGEGSQPWERFLGLEAAQAMAPPRRPLPPPPGLFRPHPPAAHRLAQLYEVSFLT